MAQKITPAICLSLVVITAQGQFNAGAQQVYSYNNGSVPSGYSIQHQDDKSIRINYSMDNFSIVPTDINGEILQKLVVPGMLLQNEEGYPDLPQNSRYIAIPQGAEAILKVISFSIETLKNVNVAPAPVIPMTTQVDPLKYERNPAVYSKNAFFPENPVKLFKQTKLRGVDVVSLGVSPFQYNPVTKDLIVYKNMTVEIVFNGGNSHFGDDAYRSRYWEPILSDMILNYGQLPAFESIAKRPKDELKITADTGYEYAIIIPTNPEFAQWADSIKKFRTEQGISTHVFKLSQIGATAAQIQTWVSDAYTNWTIKPAAMLMLADYGTGSASTVDAILYPHPGGYPNFASDNSYADVTGDDLPDLVFARIVANNSVQLQTMCTKFLNYERNPPTDPAFYSKPVTTLGWQDDRWFQLSGEIVGGYLKSIGKTPTRLNALGSPAANHGNNVAGAGNWSTNSNTPSIVTYFGNAGLKYIPDQPGTLGGFSGATGTSVNTAINAGTFMLLHRDHGYYQGWGDPAYSNTSISSLTNINNKLPFVFSINCETGAYHYSSECFVEKMHRYTKNGQNSGALAMIGDAETSYSFVNDVMVWGMFDHLWPNFMPANGAADPYRAKRPAFANVTAKYYLQQSSWASTTYKQVTYFLYHMFGDAFQWFYSEVPKNLTVVHNSVISPTDTNFYVTADAGSVIAITQAGAGGPIILGTATGTGSSVSVSLSQPATANILVTVTLQDYLRYGKSVTLGSTTSINELSGNSILSCYPNPFSQLTTVSYSLTEAGPVTITVIDMLGKEVKVLVDHADQAAGRHQVVFNGENLPKGVYSCVLKTASQVITKSLVVKE